MFFSPVQPFEAEIPLVHVISPSASSSSATSSSSSLVVGHILRRIEHARAQIDAARPQSTLYATLAPSALQQPTGAGGKRSGGVLQVNNANDPVLESHLFSLIQVFESIGSYNELDGTQVIELIIDPIINIVTPLVIKCIVDIIEEPVSKAIVATLTPLYVCAAANPLLCLAHAN